MKKSYRKKKKCKQPVVQAKIKSRQLTNKWAKTDFTCSVCSSSLRNGDDLHKHFKLSRCALGSFQKLTKRSKGQFVNDTESERGCKCSICGLTFTDCSYLELHVSQECPGASKNYKSLTNENRLSCQKRKTTNNSKTSLQEEEILNNNDLSEHIRKGECGLCHAKFGSQKDLISHFELKHEFDKDSENDVPLLKDIDYICGNCNMEFDNSKGIRDHIRDCFPDVNSLFTCRFCEREFENYDDLQSHISENHSASEFVCRQCKKSFQSSKFLVEHIASEHKFSDITGTKSSLAEVSVDDFHGATIPNSLLTKYLSKIQCNSCCNVTKLNVSEKCSFCLKPMKVKLNKIACICMQTLFNSVEKFISHLHTCEILKAVTNWNDLVLKYSRKDNVWKIYEDDNVIYPKGIHVGDIFGQIDNESIKEDKDTDSSDKLIDKNKGDGLGVIRKITECSSRHTEGGKKEVEDESSRPEEKSDSSEDDDSELSDSDLSGFEEICIDSPDLLNDGTQSSRSSNGERSILYDIEKFEMENKTENELNNCKNFVNYGVRPCKVVLDEMTLSEIEGYLGKRKCMSSPEKLERQFKRTRTQKYHGNTSINKHEFQRDRELEGTPTKAQENFPRSNVNVNKKKSFQRNLEQKESSSEGRSEGRKKSSRSNLTDKKSIVRNVCETDTKNSNVDDSIMENNGSKKRKDSKLDKLLNYSPSKNIIEKSQGLDKVECTLQNFQDITVETKESFTCEICTLTFASTQALEHHAEIHLANKMFQCGVCEEAFRSEGSLKEHMNCHVQEEEFLCGICQSKFTTADELESHIFKHFDTNVNKQDTPVNEQKMTESLVEGNADSSGTIEPSHVGEDNLSQQILPKLLAYKPKFYL